MKYALKILQIILDIIAPKDPDIERIEALGPIEFSREGELSWHIDIPDNTVSFFPYRNDLVKKSLVEIKDRPNKKIANLLGALLYRELKNLPRLDSIPATEVPIVIPIPITKKKKRMRGWNQCELIAEGLVLADTRLLFEVRTDIMYKTRETADQVGKNREERLVNLRESFALLSPDAVRGRFVIVFDDIVTTGATLGEARRALSGAGARKILSVALAH